ncbi:MAG: hypothetical protein ACXAC5_25280 [Promethearchaeota archaeon]|jgi:uncharacterized protein YndB with AHSA1/START domain
MYRYFSLLIFLALIFCIQSGFAQVKNENISGQSFSGEITISASPDRVWHFLTDVKQFTDIMGYEYTGGTKKFDKIGDYAQVKVWGENGNLMLVHANPNKELRFNLDPANGTYICNCRWILTELGKGTNLMFVERYTESGPQTKEDLEAQVKEHSDMMKKLKMKVEKK